MARGPNRILLREDLPGKTNALLAGFQAATGDAIVINDDDNIPSPDYLINAAKLLDRVPCVGVWGPGKVVVEWQTGAPGWANRFNRAFLEKNREFTEYGLVMGWPNFYPAGAGTVVRREVMETYVSGVRNGQLTATCRCGGKLSSGGDSQIVYGADKMGLCSGLSPDLAITHLIRRERGSLAYLSRLAFNVESDGTIVMLESLPELRNSLRKGLPTTFRLYATFLIQVTRSLLFGRLRQGFVSGAEWLGHYHGRFQAAGERPPALLRAAAVVFK